MGDKVYRNSLKPGYKLHWYRIDKVLGQGGFGITYLAYNFNLDRMAAIKEYLPVELAVREGDFSVHPLTDEHGKQFQWGLDRFLKEARTLAKFEHPNIVRVLDVFEDNHTAYMVMSYEEGETMQDLLNRRKTMEEEELLNILIPILGGLEKVHEIGFIHRDIKPANIFLRKDHSPVLLDFGSARQALGVFTKTLTSLVSPGYAPFEQYHSKSDAQGSWTDIYGLGATLYRAVAGVAPIDAVDRSRAILVDGKDIFIPVIKIGQGRYSGHFLRAIDHALQFREGNRPQTIPEWRQEFPPIGQLTHTAKQNSALPKEKQQTGNTPDHASTLIATDVPRVSPVGLKSAQPVTYRDPTTITNWLKFLFLACIVIDTVAFISGLLQYQVLTNIKLGIYPSEDLIKAAIESSDGRQAMIGMFQFPIYIIAMISFLVWIHRANFNVRQLGAQGMKFTPGWAVGWYFIPIANLWKPYQAMKEIWKASKNPASWEGEHRSAILPWWWFLFILNNMLGNAAFRASIDAEEIDELIASTSIVTVSNLVSIFSTIVALLLVSEIHRMQMSHVQGIKTV